VSDPYTIVLWCADSARVVSLVSAHLLHEGLSAANSGRIDDEIPMVVGVAHARRWPVFSRAVTRRGVIRARSPQVRTPKRFDYLFTITGADDIDARGLPRGVVCTHVVVADDLLAALGSVYPSEMSERDIQSLFQSVAHPLSIDNTRRRRNSAGSRIGMEHIADICQRLVTALAR